MIEQSREDFCGDEELSPQPRHFRNALRLHLEKTLSTVLCVAVNTPFFNSKTVELKIAGYDSVRMSANLCIEKFR